MKTNSFAYLIVVAAVGCGSSLGNADGGGVAGNTGSGGGAAGSTGSGGAGSGSCRNVQPCGGNLVGSWTLTEACTDFAPLQSQLQATCPQATITSASVIISGNMTFNANMTYSFSQSGTITLGWSIPLSCATDSTSCAAFAEATQAGLDPGDTFTCTGTALCACTQGAIAPALSDNGVYQVTGTSFTTTSAVTGATGASAFCVQGSTLHLPTLDPSAAGGIRSDIVAVKQ